MEEEEGGRGGRGGRGLQRGRKRAASAETVAVERHVNHHHGVITVECEDTAAPRDASLTLTPLQLAVGLVLQRPPLTLHPRRGLTVRQLLLSLRLCTVNEKKKLRDRKAGNYFLIFWLII